MTKESPIQIPSCPRSPYSSSHDDKFLDSLLPTDLIINILLRLPVKSLCKFKCVSKKCLELITDPCFISTHKKLNMSNLNILLVKKTPLSEEPHIAKIDFCALSFDGVCKNLEFSMHINDKENIKMLPSKWDLICFMCDTGFYACNPSMRTMVELPKARCSYYSICMENAGMGYIKERDEYVLVNLFYRRAGRNPDIGCEVLRLRDGMDCSWKAVDADCPYAVRGWGVLVENVFYWLIFPELCEAGDKSIVSFDLEKEEFSALTLPELWRDPLKQRFLVELGGRLCLVDPVTNPLNIDMWVLKNHNWVMEYSIQMDGYYCFMIDTVVPLHYRDGKILIYANKERLDYYDTEKKKYIRRMDRRIAREWDWISLYTESLFSLVTK